MREGYTKEVAFGLKMNFKDPAKGTNSTYRVRNECGLFGEQESQCGWRVGRGGTEDGVNEVRQDGRADLAHVNDYDKEADFFLGQQQAIGGSQM